MDEKKLYGLIEKVVEKVDNLTNEVCDVKNEITGVKSEMVEMKSDISNLKHTVTKIENEHGRKIDIILENQVQLMQTREDVKIIKKDVEYLRMK